MDLSISIVSWNVKEYLRNCLRSVFDTVNNVSFEVIVVDNNSNDETVQMVKDEFPFVKLIENKKNLGFAAANNQAIKQAKGKYILLLNPDTIILPGTIKGMVDFMNSHPEVSISSCRKIDKNGNQDLSDWIIRRYDPFSSFSFYMFIKGAVLHHFSNLLPNSKIIKKNIFNMSISTIDFDLRNKNNPVEVNVVWGSFMMMRREVIKQVGEFDESFFFEREDVDFCLRTKGAGCKIYSCPQYKIIHLKKRSISQWNKKARQDIKAYSRFLFYSKHKGKIWLFFKAFKIIITKIIGTGISSIFDFIFLIKKFKNKKKDGDLDLSTVCTDIRNLFRVIFNISPQFDRH